MLVQAELTLTVTVTMLISSLSVGKVNNYYNIMVIQHSLTDASPNLSVINAVFTVFVRMYDVHEEKLF